MTKDEIINEIRRIAEMDGKPPGMARFLVVSNIPNSKWRGKLWVRWSDALKEAGFSSNEMNAPIEKGVLIKAYLELTEALGKVPSESEIKFKKTSDKSFPSKGAIKNGLGNKSQLLQTVIKYAKDNNYPSKTISMLEDAVTPEKPQIDSNDTPEPTTGFVYLMKSGKHYKIGHTNSLDRRQYEIGLQLPEKIEPIHSIETDDPSGIEAYWHNRFKDKRLNGEWFALSLGDVRIFRNRKFM